MKKENTNKVTIYDVAWLAETSASTVSAVLNGNWKKRRISEKLADRIKAVADEAGYSANMQASSLRKERSGIIGMIVPMYDNRYFGLMAQTFESYARERGYFPVITCSFRDPDLEAEAARSLLAYRVECIVCMGATDPDRITDLCSGAGIPTINLDLPGEKAPSVISDNYSGARDLSKCLLESLHSEGASNLDVLFIGGSDTDNNTRERIRGFQDAHKVFGLEVSTNQILACGYAAEKAEASLREYVLKSGQFPKGLFVNSTISLEGIIHYLAEAGKAGPSGPRLACFDWDPIAALLYPTIMMAQQDVEGMLDVVFKLIKQRSNRSVRHEMPVIIVNEQA